MPVQLASPGVYIQEVPSGVRTIVGVATSVTAMIGSAVKGPVKRATWIQNFSEFERTFGGLSVNHPLSYAVQQFFLNGGTNAEIVRVVGANAKKAVCKVGGSELEADSEGVWMNEVFAARINHKTKDPSDTKLFNLEIGVLDPKQKAPNNFTVLEVHRNLSTKADSPRYVKTVLEEDSSLVNITKIPTDRPTEAGPVAFSEGKDGDPITAAAIKDGLSAFETVDLFNLMVIPPLPKVEQNVVVGAVPFSDSGLDVYANAAELCSRRRAMLLLDPPTAWTDVEKAAAGMESTFNGIQVKKDAAVYFPMLKMPDPLREGRITEFPPSAAVAGVFARTDANRGVWKAPAGQTDGALAGVKALSLKLTDGENGRLNPLGLNCLRTFPVIGNVIWGARTLDGADRLMSEWKYVPIRRLALFIEESLLRGTQFAVFEPNDEPLWAQLRSAIGSFMQGLFRQGAFQGQSPAAAYFVKVDGETTTEDDRNLGIVNIHVGFAPLKPAEFVVIHLQQMAGQTA